MTKVNEDLGDPAMGVLIAFQKSHNLSTRGKALNALLVDYGQKSQLFR
jgi:hypothetical protein